MDFMMIAGAVVVVLLGLYLVVAFLKPELFP